MRALTPIRGRYAPSPTGDLHLGNARTALVAWLAARSRGGTFLLRVEDLDPPRVVSGAEAAILEDLRWLGLDWDEGPDTGGAHAPYRQSERSGRYLEALRALADAGRLYACTCSRAELRGLLSAPHGPGVDGPRYPGTCRDRDIAFDLHADPDARVRRPALRFRADSAGPVRIEDAVFGELVEDVAESVGDFIVRRSDGLFTYQLAVTVDDAAMGVNQVVRGADLLHSTARQALLLQALGAEVPKYGHVPLVLDSAGERLAKRERPVSVAAVRSAGVASQRLVGLMAWSLGLVDAPDPVTPEELVRGFRWDRIGHEPWRISRTEVLRLAS